MYEVPIPMSVSPLHLTSNFNSYMSGEVTIDPSAAIASGVVLLADPNSTIIIAAGVCIGMGVILHARNGVLEVEAGANLGAGVLMVGTGKIGANACIGSATTIIDYSIEPGTVVAPSSLLGDTSRQVNFLAANTVTTSPETALTFADESKNPEAELKEPEVEQPEPSPGAIQPAGNHVVYGKDSISRLIATLLPYSQSLKQPLQDSSSSDT